MLFWSAVPSAESRDLDDAEVGVRLDAARRDDLPWASMIVAPAGATTRRRPRRSSAAQTTVPRSMAAPDAVWIRPLVIARAGPAAVYACSRPPPSGCAARCGDALQCVSTPGQGVVTPTARAFN